MATYIYDKATGQLHAYNPDDAGQVASDDVLAAKGLEVVSGLEPQDDTHAWDAATKSVIVVDAPVYPRMLDAYRFILSFTPEEYDAIKKSSDLNVQLLFEALRSVGTIDLNGKTTIQGVGYLQSVGLLTSQRAAQILAGPA